ncbi:hypothetical protein SAMN06265339_0698 [Desulfurobacterium pacificum]|uniref:Uncharacterized protein n=1 Tax=Desulfurobacterium pacificum TaxID=240166 RepID=A0ABY1NHE0_9BACT|nr:hypothetical protein [Desulfurobacterium pacificum]SMP09138.1 hypothetical protein SAMN06265339_0698 [Desulfurobacterium pacificum]
MPIAVEDRELIEKACEVLVKELGLIGFVRFVKLMGWAKRNWTEERKEVLKELEEKLMKMTTEEVVEYFAEGRKVRPG